MKHTEFIFKEKVWMYPGKASWYFVSVPQNISEEITNGFGDLKRGWGSLRVRVIIGKTTWDTSIFPDSKTATYLLPIKASVRRAEAIATGKYIQVFLTIKT